MPSKRNTRKRNYLGGADTEMKDELNNGLFQNEGENRAEGAEGAEGTNEKMEQKENHHLFFNHLHLKIM